MCSSEGLCTPEMNVLYSHFSQYLFWSLCHRLVCGQGWPSTIMFFFTSFLIIVADLKAVSLAVAGVNLSEHLVEVVITLFDEDGKYRYT